MTNQKEDIIHPLQASEADVYSDVRSDLQTTIEQVAWNKPSLALKIIFKVYKHYNYLQR